MDETYLKVRGKWVYLYRAIDRDGNLIDARLSEHRDIEAKGLLPLGKSDDRLPTRPGDDGWPWVLSQGYPPRRSDARSGIGRAPT